MYAELGGNWASNITAGSTTTNNSSGSGGGSSSSSSNGNHASGQHHRASTYNSKFIADGGVWPRQGQMDTQEKCTSSRQPTRQANSKRHQHQSSGPTREKSLANSSLPEPMNLSRAIVVAAADESVAVSCSTAPNSKRDDTTLAAAAEAAAAAMQQQQSLKQMQFDLMAALSEQSMQQLQQRQNYPTTGASTFLHHHHHHHTTTTTTTTTRHLSNQQQQQQRGATSASEATAQLEAHRRLQAQLQFASLRGLSAVASALQHQHLSTITTASGRQMELSRAHNSNNNMAPAMGRHNEPAEQRSSAGNGATSRRGRKLRKCRKMYGIERRQLWCTQCKWKKACSRFCDLRHPHHHRPHHNQHHHRNPNTTSTNINLPGSHLSPSSSSASSDQRRQQQQQCQLMLASAALHHHHHHGRL